jgi:chromate transporter
MPADTTLQAQPQDAPRVPLRELAAVWLHIGLLSFGGPAGQIALMHREIVERRRWLSEAQYLNAVSFCMLLPGPEATQIATYAGWKNHGWRGGMVAGGLFVLPGAAVMLALAALYGALGGLAWFQTLFLGVKAAVVVIVIEALLRVARRALGAWDRYVLAGLAFAAIFFFDLPYPLIVAAAALYGFVAHGGAAGDAPLPARVPLARTAGTVGFWLLLWLSPLAVLALVDPGGILLDIGLFFTKLAVVTFGGAYAVLAYMAQDAVQQYGWLSAEAMLDGLGLAETTPGPLILVTEFVGYIAAGTAGGAGLALAGALLTLWVTFVPCYLWIFTGAPYIEWITAQPRLKGALTGIMAAVVGVILNLSLWFALHVFFDEVARVQLGPAALWWPEAGTLNPGAVGLALLAAVLLLRLRWGLLTVLGICAALGVAIEFAAGRF